MTEDTPIESTPSEKIPVAEKAFAALGLHKNIVRALEEHDFTEPTEVQRESIPAVLSGRDIMVSARTGSGKTGAFLLPMLDRFLAEDKPQTGTRGLILLPTRELALQTDKAFKRFAAYTRIRAGLVIGGEPFKYQISTIRKNPEVIIATPGRLVEHVEKGHMDFRDLEFLVLDEADRMLDMGFAEAMDTIAKTCAETRQTLLYSATLTHKGLSGVGKNLREPVKLELDKRTDIHENIVQQNVLADDDHHKEKLIAALIEQEQAEKVMVFCKTRLQVQKVSNLLRAKKLVSGFIHGEVAQSERKQVLNRFRDGKLKVLVATDVAARGLDIQGVDLVINYTMAQSGDEHVHRVGRTGRMNAVGKSINLISANDWNLMSSIERYLKLRFELRKVKGLEAKYTGPKKLKKSGKAAGKKNKAPESPWRKASNSSKSKKPGSGKSTKLGSTKGPSKKSIRGASEQKLDGGFAVFKPRKK